VSNAEKFFKLYEELASDFPDHKGFIESLGVKQVRCFRNRINKYRKAGTVPPPSMLKSFKGVMDPNFLLECMDEYMDDYKSNDTWKFDNIKMEFVNSYRKEESEEVKQKKKNEKKGSCKALPRKSLECGRIKFTLASREKLVSDKCIKKLKIRMEELLYTE
jgi:hypothetical protein